MWCAQFKSAIIAKQLHALLTCRNHLWLKKRQMLIGEYKISLRNFIAQSIFILMNYNANINNNNNNNYTLNFIY